MTKERTKDLLELRAEQTLANIRVFADQGLVNQAEEERKNYIAIRNEIARLEREIENGC